MKRIFTLFLALALSASGISAFAQEQDKQLANHLALGITLGLDGVGLEAALPITPVPAIPFSLIPSKDLSIWETWK